MLNNNWTTEELDQHLCYQIEAMWFVQEEHKVCKVRNAQKALKAQYAPQTHKA